MYWLMRSANCPPVNVVSPRNSTGLSLWRFSAPTVRCPEWIGWGSRSSLMLNRLERVTEPVSRADGLGFSPSVSEETLRATILDLARQRGASSSICPSDAARAIGGDDWRE